MKAKRTSVFIASRPLVNPNEDARRLANWTSWEKQDEVMNFQIIRTQFKNAFFDFNG